MKYLYQILWKDQSRKHLFWAMIGTLLGFILLLSGIHFYRNIQEILSENEDLLDPEYIVINKKVGIGRTLGLGSNTFSDKEIQDLAAQDFAQGVSPFIANEFPVSALTHSQQFPNFYTDLFFEAVPDEFLDIKSDEWVWNDSSTKIPVVLPQDYLNLYNFGFAQSQGLPQIPKELISMVGFTLKLKGRFDKPTYEGKIIGFSNRINSILVPYDFLSWANEKYGYMKESGASRLILVSNDPTDPAILEYIQAKGYETIQEKLKSSRLNIILKFILSFLVIIAGIIIGLAFLIFLLGLQLMMSRSARKIKRLHTLGFTYLDISKPYIMLLSVLMFIVAVFSLLGTMLINAQLSILATGMNLEIEQGISWSLLLLALSIMTGLWIFNSISVVLASKRICNT